MKFRIFIFFVFVSIAGLAIFLLWQKPKTQQSNNQITPVLHYANHSEIPIKQISIRAVYFVPKGQVAAKDDVWLPALKQALKDSADFYQKQLGIKVEFFVYQKTIIGEQEGLFYDSLETKAGNPSAVNAIRDELQKRLLERSGDLYERHFAFSPDSFNVLAILYEGVGSGGTVDLGPADFIKQGSLPTFLLARNFLTEENYQDYGTSFFAHEFGHTLGLPDNYDTKTGKPYSDDLMGSGRYRPLEATYILDKDKNSLGFKL